ncbi:MAG: RdgB/HAM1 family non-canonical purine NTP pyrophosphatase [Ruminococcus sp.]|nr:RdgB/HAM1 family non-canonical purine NTP pyrophosphatase [Ruminococcus sp.]
MINKLVMATNNKNKLREARQILSPLGIEVLSQQEAGVDIEPVEDGQTFEENALIKAEAIYNAVKVPVIADDSGLCVDALGGRPSVHSARYAPKGQECDKILTEMKDVPEDKRTAYFECCIVYIDSEGTESMTGKCYGTIAYAQKGTDGFGYDPIFLYGDRTLAEMSPDEKNSISHRGEAMKKLYEYLEKKKGE